MSKPNGSTIGLFAVRKCKRGAFISVGADGQELIRLMDRAWFFLRKLMIFTFGPISGIVSTVRRGLDPVTRRLDSSLRSHQTLLRQLGFFRQILLPLDAVQV